MKVATAADHARLIEPRLERASAKWERIGKPLAGSRREFPETCKYADYLRSRRDLSRLDWWHTPNELATPGRGADPKWRARRGGQNKDAGVLSGVSDFIIAVPVIADDVIFHGLCLEMKRENATAARLSNSQRAFLFRRREMGWIVAWARGGFEAQLIHEAIYGQG